MNTLSDDYHAFLDALLAAKLAVIQQGMSPRDVATTFMGIAAAEARLMGFTKEEFLAIASKSFDSWDTEPPERN